MKQLKLTVSNRKETGRGAARRLRASGKVPAVIYGKSGSRPLTLEEPKFRKLMRATSGAAAIIEIEDENKQTALSVIQEVSRDPVKDTFTHVDFHEVSATEEMHAVLPVHTKGEAYGAKNQGGLVDIVIYQVDIQCLPKDLPEYVEIDVSELRVGQAVHIKELPKLPGVKYLHDADSVVLGCFAPTKAEAPSAPAEEDAEGEDKPTEGTEAKAEEKQEKEKK